VRRSLRLRLLGLSLAVAVLAVGATAFLAAYGTGSRLREELAADASLLETDSDIRAELVAYANEHRDWGGAGEVVRALAERTGRRIALTTQDDVLIADSARGDLPPVPAARIDAATERDTAAPNVVARGAGLAFYQWQLTEEEQRARQALADAAAECLRHSGDEPAQWRYQHLAGDGTAPPIGSTCVPPELLAPSAASVALQQEIADRTEGCRAAHGPDSPEWTTCAETARVAAKRPHVAPPADLYLGTGDRFDPFSPDGWWWTAATAVAVLLGAAVLTAPAARRLVRPIHALTAAAQRMAAGDRTARVPVRGNDEVTRLAAAFNTMADALDEHDRQRKALVGDVAHELRTPLANLRCHLEAAQDGVVPLGPGLVQSLIEENALLERLVADLQDLALADAGMLRLHPEERDATDLAEQAVAAHRASAEASGVDLRLDAPAPVVVQADPLRLRQALGNLVSNAVRHTPAGGTVTVAVRHTGDGVVLTVADTGAGIAGEHLPHIFDRLYRADPSRSRSTGGSGLGLAITRHLVEAHDGELTVTSTPGDGSTFTIRLPGA
jgi:two-component system sensor histidine kinase BaeS